MLWSSATVKSSFCCTAVSALLLRRHKTLCKLQKRRPSCHIYLLTALTFSSSLCRWQYNLVLTSQCWHHCKHCSSHNSSVRIITHLQGLSLHWHVFPGYHWQNIQQLGHGIIPGMFCSEWYLLCLPSAWRVSPISSSYHQCCWTTLTCVSLGSLRSTYQLETILHARDLLGEKSGESRGSLQTVTPMEEGKEVKRTERSHRQQHRSRKG